MTINEAYEFGKQAYAKGLPWIPANDKEFLVANNLPVPFAKYTRQQHKDSRANIKAWSKGWNDTFTAVFWAQETAP